MVSLILISHSATLADGVRDLAQQMAPDATLHAVGGSADGGIGTDFDRVLAALTKATSNGGAALVLMDLGSAVMTAETALDFLDEAARQRVALSNAPLVEGALAAAVTAGAGSDLATVVAAANEARTMHKVETPDEAAPAPPTAQGDVLQRKLSVLNPVGLHARPAAQVVRALSGLDAVVTLARPDGRAVPATSIVGLLGLGARQGETLVAEAHGPQANQALAGLEALFAEGFGEMEVERLPDDAAQPAKAATAEVGWLRGYATSPGIAIGPAYPLATWTPPDPPAPPDDPDAERARLEAALDQVRAALATEGAASRGDARAILDAQLLLLDDPLLLEEARTKVATLGAVQAWWQTTSDQAERLRQSGDRLIAARASDLLDVGRRVARVLVGSDGEAATAPAGAIVLAEELGPAEMGALHRCGVAAIVLGGGGPTAHAAILARAFTLPAVTGVGSTLTTVTAGDTLLVDGDEGTIRIAPTEQEIEAAERARCEAQRRRDALLAEAQQPAITRDGRRIEVVANVSSVAEAEAAVANGAEGVGLLRTEFLILDRPTMPDEATQVAKLRAIFTPLGQRPIIVRTMDIGGDKPAAALDLNPVTHGFLGLRGLRYCLAHPALFHTHLRALLRAAEGYRISVMFPMVTTVNEVRAARAALDAARAALDAEGVPHGEMKQVGVMIEVPAAALAADELAAEVDFFSVGSNDLVQYTMAAERTNQSVASLYQPTHPAIRRLLMQTVAGAASGGAWVGLCGEMAGDPKLTEMLVDLGITELSMAPAAIPAVKAAVRAL